MPTVSNKYPTGADLLPLLKDTGIAAPTATRLDILCAQAARRFEKLTGWQPFLSTNTSTTRVFDSPNSIPAAYLTPTNNGRVLKLDQGLLSIDSLTIGGEAKTVGTDFWLRPNNASPYFYIEFARPFYSKPQGISITGKWGYCLSLPEDSWSAILRIAAIMVATEYAAQVTGGVVEWSEEVTEKYGERPFGFLIDGWQEYVDSVVDTYKRWGAWF